jgi:predicted RNA-binding protein YlqC (UPF0109 family)
MKDILEIMVRAMVDQPDLVSVTEVGGLHASIFELKVAKDDVGKIIGKQGRNADALRTLLKAAAAKSKKRAVLEIAD